MYPHERSLVQRLENKPFTIIGVNSDSDISRAQKAVKNNDLTWRSFWDGRGGPIAAQYGVRSWPTIYFIDHNGIIRDKDKRGEKADKAIDQLLAAIPVAD